MKLRFLLLASSLIAIIVSGCNSGRICACKPLNELGAIPDNNGSSVNQWLCRQTENAQFNKGFIYRSDWIGSSDTLGPFGKKTLSSWAKLAGVQPQIFVETSGDSYLDSQRQVAISSYLAGIGVGLQPQSVRVANAPEGLVGEEVPVITDRFLSEGSSSSSQNSQTRGGFSSINQGGIF